jgi:predicted AAA+ superfamily ATPase
MSKTLLDRKQDQAAVAQLMRVFPVTALLGPRQAGKTTLAKTFQPDHYFDLENPRDLTMLEQPQLALENLEGLIMIDEIQRKPELFSLLRYLVDQQNNQKYLILGSASSSLKQQSGESLAGRIGYYYLSGFNLPEVGAAHYRKLWLRGGFPRSYLAEGLEESRLWRENFIATFLERDLAALGSSIPSSTMYRFWVMLSHYHGQTLNYSELGRSFGISDHTVKKYISILEDTFMIRILLSWHTNVGKRLVKSPKLYIRDAGLFHTLQNIHQEKDLLTNPKLGASWEGFAVEETIAQLGKRDNEVFFYGTHAGVELDLYWHSNGRSYGAEFKYMDAPKRTRSMHQAIEDLNLSQLYVIYPGNREYALSEQIRVLPLQQLGGL